MNRHPFDMLMEMQTDQIRLDCAALHLARDAYPDINFGHYLRKLDALAEEVSELRPGISAPQRYTALHEVLVERAELRGNDDDYYDPDNTYVNRVLDRGHGNPIALSVVWIEVGRRLKWPVSGVGFPGHFLVRIDDPERYVVVDPFQDGRTLSLEDCKQLHQHHADNRTKFSQNILSPVDTRSILVRMLNNLRQIYLAAEEWPRLKVVLSRLLAVEPNSPRHLQDLASVECRLGNVRGAAAHLAAYLQRSPDADDSRIVRSSLHRLRAAMIALN